MKVCDALDDVKGRNFAVRSIHLPEGSSMTLYSQKSFDGETITVYQSEPDME